MTTDGMRIDPNDAPLLPRSHHRVIPLMEEESPPRDGYHRLLLAFLVQIVQDARQADAEALAFLRDAAQIAGLCDVLDLDVSIVQRYVQPLLPALPLLRHDMRSGHGRGRRSGHRGSLLTPHYAAITQAVADGVPCRVLAQQYGVDESTIWKFLARERSRRQQEEASDA